MMLLKSDSFRFGLAVLAMLFSACQNTGSVKPIVSLTSIYPTSLRDAPGEKGKEICPIPAGTELVDEGRVSSFLSEVVLNDTMRQEPWLQVQTPAGMSGWIFAGAVYPKGASAAAARKWLLYRRFESWFGPELAQRWTLWSEAPFPPTDSLNAVRLREGLALRDTLNVLISRKVLKDAGHSLPDLYWLAETTPCFVVQKILDGATYALFLDFRNLGREASRTTGPADDGFAEIGYAAFPTDSIESPLPVWMFPASAESGYSNLGQGLHTAMLKRIDSALQDGALFAPELLQLKDEILADILNQDRLYWQPREKILRELSALADTRLDCLTERDRLALRSRITMFQGAGENGIKLNLRAGG